MTYKIFILSISIFLVFSCSKTKKSISNEDLNLLLSKNISKYHQTNDESFLLSVYDTLSYNTDFIEQGLIGKNSLPIISLLMNLKKYNELEKLLMKNKTINEYNRLSTLNTVRYLKLKKVNKVKANSYIKESIILIKNRINKEPKDSLLFLDYFSMKILLVGKKNVLKEIDSMQIVNKNYSIIFYENILKENIENYPDEQL